jgi:hypothetical protein
MQCIIKINMGNAAFENFAGAELARILRFLANELDSGELAEAAVHGGKMILRDANGNACGRIRIEHTDE